MKQCTAVADPNSGKPAFSIDTSNSSSSSGSAHPSAQGVNLRPPEGSGSTLSCVQTVTLKPLLVVFTNLEASISVLSDCFHIDRRQILRYRVVDLTPIKVRQITTEITTLNRRIDLIWIDLPRRTFLCRNQLLRSYRLLSFGSRPT